MTTDNWTPPKRGFQSRRPKTMTDPKPFLGELRAVQFAAVPPNAGFTIEIAGVVVTRLEQWNGKEWITVHEFWP
jgi:alpha-D-ribose 1-methylphosphonate 5-triphosphate synthase subunit PhnI